MKYRTRKLIKPEDLNPRKTLFGGKVGNTSITIACDVRNKITKQTIVRIDEIVFVLLDEEGKPKSHGKNKEVL